MFSAFSSHHTTLSLSFAPRGPGGTVDFVRDDDGTVILRARPWAPFTGGRKDLLDSAGNVLLTHCKNRDGDIDAAGHNIPRNVKFYALGTGADSENSRAVILHVTQSFGGTFTASYINTNTSEDSDIIFRTRNTLGVQHRTIDFTLGSNGTGRRVARLSLPSKIFDPDDRYSLAVEPGVDAALIAVLCLCVDERLGAGIPPPPPTDGDGDDEVVPVISYSSAP
ncbi:hypothetical protein EXIGLDRAFT_725549 [Exidia glandulosa HHB12029]|uniref:Tubby C-terminal-like domain-containing protein n=1 Tax=Exidia glandulosa HHB12029 TaxID=1314781 RepID=A0A165DZI2_EXIGL|nr:hypothetical protein EXIGLDRAFT_725549 [Exidia glandulosa HHB12029]